MICEDAQLEDARLLTILKTKLNSFFSDISKKYLQSVLMPEEAEESETSEVAESDDSEIFLEVKKKPKIKSRFLITTEEQRPKAPTSSFLLYYHQNKQDISLRFNETNASKLTKLASQCWRELPEDERQDYIRRSDASKARYREQMKVYKAKYASQIEEAMKKRRAEYRNNWINKKRAQEVSGKREEEEAIKLSDNSVNENKSETP